VVVSALPVRVRCALLEGAELPRYATPGSSGLDLRAVSWRRSYEGTDVRRVTGIDLDPGERVFVHSGLAVELPEGLEGHVRPRSGLATRHGVGVVFLGTIDCDYRGEIGVTLINLGDARVTLERFERVAQLVVVPVVRVQLEVVDELGDTERGAGGYGSTGRK
jgi:dUTP pyrophosphatase